MTYFTESGAVEPKSDTPSSFGKIYERAAFSKKKMKLGVWRSAVRRYEGECGSILSPKTLNRKRETAEKIARIRRAGAKYLYLAANEKAKVTVDKMGREMVLVRNNGKFTGEKIIFN
jgi:hypothetical protein